MSFFNPNNYPMDPSDPFGIRRQQIEDFRQGIPGQVPLNLSFTQPLAPPQPPPPPLPPTPTPHAPPVGSLSHQSLSPLQAQRQLHKDMGSIFDKIMRLKPDDIRNLDDRTRHEVFGGNHADEVQTKLYVDAMGMADNVRRRVFRDEKV